MIVRARAKGHGIALGGRERRDRRRARDDNCDNSDILCRSRDGITRKRLLGCGNRSRGLHDDHLRLRARATTDGHLRLAIVDFARRLALHARPAKHAFAAPDRLVHPDAIQRRLHHTLGVALVKQGKAQAEPDGARAAHVPRTGLLRDRPEVARLAKARIAAVAAIVEASEQSRLHRDFRGLCESSHFCRTKRARLSLNSLARSDRRPAGVSCSNRRRTLRRGAFDDVDVAGGGSFLSHHS